MKQAILQNIEIIKYTISSISGNYRKNYNCNCNCKVQRVINSLCGFSSSDAFYNCVILDYM